MKTGMPGRKAAPFPSCQPGQPARARAPRDNLALRVAALGAGAGAVLAVAATWFRLRGAARPRRAYTRIDAPVREIALPPMVLA